TLGFATNRSRRANVGMSAFGGKADMRGLAPMSAFDPKRTFSCSWLLLVAAEQHRPDICAFEQSTGLSPLPLPIRLANGELGGGSGDRVKCATGLYSVLPGPLSVLLRVGLLSRLIWL